MVIRPKGGLNISKIGGPAITAAIFQATGIPEEERAADTICPNVQQNIIVVIAPSASNLHKYLRMKGFRVGGNMYEVNSYEAAPSLTIKGVIRGIPLEDDARTVDENVVNSRNPTALAAKRLANTTTVIVAFDGLEVPTLVRYGATVLRCTLYRKQIDVCYQCERLGHRMDVCPTPHDKICRGCGARNPSQEHQCTPDAFCAGVRIPQQTNCAGRASKRPILSGGEDGSEERKRRWSWQPCKPPSIQPKNPKM